MAPPRKSFERCLVEFGEGVRSCVYLHRSVEFFVHSESIQSRTWSCLAVNGVFVVGMLVFEYLPFVVGRMTGGILSMVFLSSSLSSSSSSSSSSPSPSSLLSPSPVPPVPTPLGASGLGLGLGGAAASYLFSFFPPVSFAVNALQWASATAYLVTYYILWVLPIYALSFVANQLLYREIGHEAHRLVEEARATDGSAGGDPAAVLRVGDGGGGRGGGRGGAAQSGAPVVAAGDESKGRKSKKTARTWFAALAEGLYRYLLVVLLIAQPVVMCLVPFVGLPLSFGFSCFVASFYAFDMKWSLRGISLQRRLDTLEENWPYYLGWGLPPTLCTFFFPTFFSLGVYALIFPFLLVMASASDDFAPSSLADRGWDRAEGRRRSRKGEDGDQQDEVATASALSRALSLLPDLPVRLPIFSVARTIVDKVILFSDERGKKKLN